MRVHVTAAFYVLACALFLGMSRGEIAVLLLTVGTVLTAEMFNTSLEKFCDFSQRRFSAQIRIVKDIAAGAVLIAAVFAVFVGITIFCRPALIDFLFLIVTTPQYLVPAMGSLVAAWFFIFWGPTKIYHKLKREPGDR